MEHSGLLSRVERALNDGAMAALSGGLPLSDLQSLLLAVFRQRAAARTPADVLAQYGQNRFVRPSPCSPVRLAEIDLAFFRLTQGLFTAMELSPLAPFGAASSQGFVDQNNVVTTIRGTEVASDLTNVMALECALRRRALLQQGSHSMEPVRLCASQRLTRAQPNDDPASFAHFKIAALCTAGHDGGNLAFERAAIEEHIAVYLRLVAALGGLGYRFDGLRLELIAYQPVFAETVKQIAGQGAWPGVEVSCISRPHQHYYRALGFHLFARNTAGEEYFLADGGVTDWTQRLLGNRKERLFVSGMGTERLPFCFLPKE